MPGYRARPTIPLMGFNGDDRGRRPDQAEPMRLCRPGAVAFRLEAAALERRPPASSDLHEEQAERPFAPTRATTSDRLPVADGFELDLAAHELRHAGRPVRLRPMEFQLLATLAADPGRAFTRRQLLDLAWNPRHPIDLRTVDVHVHWLRSKIEPEPARPTHLVTVRGFGYRLDPWPR